jgi:hypothetical protein
MKLAHAILYCFKIAIGSVLLLLVFDPANYANVSQRSIMEEYLNVYCLKPEEARKDPAKYAAHGALMSRLTIKANLGSLALLEYAKCKAVN